MAVFVRFFRLAMLFFNVYDSYKVLKLPPPSAQNKGRPSLRAMSQRKRDMKGCLAVWIVWSCFITYERFVEVVISLFIPFYDEFKSLAMLFLIMTRARGAEPIYLHIIRPFLKPYTSTIDQLLDFAHVVGDVALGLAALPFIYVVEWWQRRFGAESDSLDTETEASSSPLSPVPSDEAQPLVARANSSKSVKTTTNSGSKPRQTVAKRSSVNITDQKKGQKPPSSSIDQVTNGPSPPKDLPTSDDAPIDGLPQTDEWRQYPAFPSAYPPTPLAKQAQIVADTIVSTSATLYPPIPEEPTQQGFRQSLLSPHNDLNPSYVGALSDDTNACGVQSEEVEQVTISVMDVDDFDEPMDEADELESEDEFNITLRTPDPPLRILTSLSPPSPLSNDASPLSLPSRSSALTTADDRSSLCTPSTESSISSDAPALPPTFSSHKRTIQSSTVNAGTRASRMASRGTSVTVARTARSPIKRAVTQRRQVQRHQNVSSRKLDGPGSSERENEPSSTAASLDGDELSSKRRRVSLMPPKAVRVTQPIRRRTVHPAPPAAKMTRGAAAQRHSTPPSTTLSEPVAKLVTLSSREGSVTQEDLAPPSHDA